MAPFRGRPRPRLPCSISSNKHFDNVVHFVVAVRNVTHDNYGDDDGTKPKSGCRRPEKRSTDGPTELHTCDAVRPLGVDRTANRVGVWRFWHCDE